MERSKQSRSLWMCLARKMEALLRTNKITFPAKLLEEMEEVRKFDESPEFITVMDSRFQLITGGVVQSGDVVVCDDGSRSFCCNGIGRPVTTFQDYLIYRNLGILAREGRVGNE